MYYLSVFIFFWTIKENGIIHVFSFTYSIILSFVPHPINSYVTWLVMDVLERATLGSHMTQVNLLGYDLYLSKAHTNTDYKNEKNRINKEPRPAEEEPRPL